MPTEQVVDHFGIPFPEVSRLEDKWGNIPRPEPNYTPPGKTTFVDIFKGRDDEDFIKKSLIMTRYATITTGFVSLADMMVTRINQDLLGKLRIVGFWAVPLMGGGLVYTSGVCIAGSLRKKNDQWNHFIGSVAVGSLIGATRRSVIFGFLASLGIGVFGTLYKESVMNGWEVWPDLRPKKLGYAFSHENDYTTVPYSKGNWYTDPTPQPRSPLPSACK